MALTITLLTKFRNNSFLATKSVSQFTYTMTTFDLHAVTIDPITPSLVERLTRF